MKKVSITLLLIPLLAAGTLNAQSVAVNENNIALGGYDVVAYFNSYEAVRGSSEFSATADGATYYFRSADNAAAFKANPSKYQPQYGGYCAFAVAMKNAKVPADPETFKIRDGKLYVFFNDYYEGKPFNTIVPWNENEASLMKKADSNWSTLK